MTRGAFVLAFAALALLGVSQTVVYIPPPAAEEGGDVYQQVISGNHLAALSVLAAPTTIYLAPQQNGSGASTTTLESREVVVPTGGVFSNFQVWLSGDVGDTGDDVTIALYKNGSASVLSCAITGGVGTEEGCTEDADTLEVAQGDTLTMGIDLPSGSTPAAVYVRWSMVWTPTTAGEFIYMANHSETNATRVIVGHPNGNAQSVVIPFAGTLKKLCARASSAIASGSFTIAASVNGSTASLPSVTLNSGTQSACDNSVTGALNGTSDTYGYSVTDASASTPRLAISSVIVPTTSGLWAIVNDAGTEIISNTRYAALGYNFWAGSATTAELTRRHKAFSLEGMYVTLDADPTPGSITFDAWDGSASQMSVTVSAGNTTGNNTTPFSVSDGGVLLQRHSVASSPTVSRAKIVYVGKRVQP